MESSRRLAQAIYENVGRSRSAWLVGPLLVRRQMHLQSLLSSLVWPPWSQAMGGFTATVHLPPAA